MWIWQPIKHPADNHWSSDWSVVSYIRASGEMDTLCNRLRQYGYCPTCDFRYWSNLIWIKNTTKWKVRTAYIYCSKNYKTINFTYSHNYLLNTISMLILQYSASNVSTMYQNGQSIMETSYITSCHISRCVWGPSALTSELVMSTTLTANWAPVCLCTQRRTILPRLLQCTHNPLNYTTQLYFKLHGKGSLATKRETSQQPGHLQTQPTCLWQTATVCSPWSWIPTSLHHRYINKTATGNYQAASPLKVILHTGGWWTVQLWQS